MFGSTIPPTTIPVGEGSLINFHPQSPHTLKMAKELAIQIVLLVIGGLIVYLAWSTGNLPVPTE